MGFNIVVVGSEGSLVAELFLRATQNLSWTISIAESLFSAQDGQSCAHFLGKHRPSAVVCFASEREAAHTHSCLNQLLPYCAERGVPFITTSSYLALDAVDAFGDDVPDSTLVPKAASHESTNAYAELEQLAGELEKHIILRTSWVVDASSPNLLSRFMEKIRGEEDFIVSDVHYGRPVNALFVSDALVAIIQQVLTGAQNWGLYHVQSSDKCSEAEFCDQLIRHAGKHTGEEYRDPVVASSDSSVRFLQGAANLSGRKLTDDFGIQLVSWRKGFSVVLHSWLQDNVVLTRDTPKMSDPRVKMNALNEQSPQRSSSELNS